MTERFTGAEKTAIKRFLTAGKNWLRSPDTRGLDEIVDAFDELVQQLDKPPAGRRPSETPGRTPLP